MYSGAERPWVGLHFHCVVVCTSVMFSKAAVCEVLKVVVDIKAGPKSFILIAIYFLVIFENRIEDPKNCYRIESGQNHTIPPLVEKGISKQEMKTDQEISSQVCCDTKNF